MYSTKQLTHTRRSDVLLSPDDALRVVTKKQILHYHQLYTNRPDPISFLTVTVETSVRIYYDFSRLLFLHAHREGSVLTNEIPEESTPSYISFILLQINTIN